MKGWLADESLISRVLHRCVGKEMCKQLKELARSAVPPYRVILPDAADPRGLGVVESYNVAQYAPMSRELLEPKVSQYPPGTIFVLFRAWPLTEDQRKLEDKVQVIFAKRGTLLEKPTN